MMKGGVTWIPRRTSKVCVRFRGISVLSSTSLRVGGSAGLEGWIGGTCVAKTAAFSHLVEWTPQKGWDSL